MKANNLSYFAKTITDILNSNRYVLLIASGDMGEGKSCFLTKLGKLVAKNVNLPFTYKDNITYSRKELKEWVDGKGPEKKNQKAKHSCIIADELINMFFKRTHYDSEQISGIQLLNKCRDRQLFISGAVPEFWDLDKGIYAPCTFWVHIYERGRAWVFIKNKNPWSKDKWNIKENFKAFEKDGTPYNCTGFLCELTWEDWDPQEKIDYQHIRDTKRNKNEEEQARKNIRLRKVLRQRDDLIKLIVKKETNISQVEIAETIGVSEPVVSRIVAKT